MSKVINSNYTPDRMGRTFLAMFPKGLSVV
jgi:hypothetical protein